MLHPEIAQMIMTERVNERHEAAVAFRLRAGRRLWHRAPAPRPRTAWADRTA